MSTVDYRSQGPELDNLTSHWPVAFDTAQNGLREALDKLYVQNEDTRESLKPAVQERLDACRWLGALTEIPLPTPVMSEAEGALGIQQS